MIEASQHPFINATLGDNNDILISVDGLYALKYTLAEKNITELLNIHVNDEAFFFSIMLSIPQN